jgi:hypothetical protein
MLLQRLNPNGDVHAKAKPDQEEIEDLASRTTCTKPISRRVGKLTRLPRSLLRDINIVIGAIRGLANPVKLSETVSFIGRDPNIGAGFGASGLATSASYHRSATYILRSRNLRTALVT